MADSHARSVLYWVFAGLLCGFGLLGLASIGIPFLLMGLTLLLVGPWRDHRRIFWPIVMGVLGFILGFALITPLGCTTSATSAIPARPGVPIEESYTTCSNALGLDYSGSGNYSPPRAPARTAGLVVGAAGALTGFILAMRASTDV